jgi:TRAP-type mannitol/chloroaromatic compound transport system permease large subunit
MAVNEILDVLMFASLCAAILLGFPVAFTLAGSASRLPSSATRFGVFNLAILGAFPQRIFGVMTNQVLIAVPLFIFMGVMLERSKVAEQLLDSMSMLFGRLRGGLGYSVCIVGALLAASTGIVGATVVTMGLLALPTMLKRGYDPRWPAAPSAPPARWGRSSRLRSCSSCSATCCPPPISSPSSSRASFRPKPSRSATCSPAPCFPA